MFWVHASTGARFEEGYKIIADRLGLLGRNDPQANILQLVKNWLCEESNGRWVMIVDNADDTTPFFGNPVRELVGNAGRRPTAPPLLASFLPQSQNGSILFTSRSEDIAFHLTGDYNNIIRVWPMNQAEGLALFEKKLNHHYDKDTALELLLALDYMPLAITQAAAYINRLGPRGSISKYLDFFYKNDRSKASLLDRETGDLRRDERARNSIIITWQISFEQIRDERPSAAGLLSLMSFFNHQGIPEFVLQGYASNQDVNVGMDEEQEFDEDLATLSSYCLITTDIEGNTFEMHRLVQFATRRWLEVYNELDSWRQKFLIALSAEYPTGDFEQWSKCEVLFPHAEAAAMNEPGDEESLRHWSQVLNNAADYAWARGRYEVGASMARKAMNVGERVVGREHSQTLRSIHILALLLEKQGKYKAAEEMNRQAMDRREKVLGKKHPDTLASMSNLALVLQYQGKCKAAEKINKQVLNGREKMLGKKHPSTLISMSNLAVVLKKQGKYEAAEKMNQQALNRCEKMLGKEHPDTLTSMNNLALVLQRQGKYEAAEEMSQQALNGREKFLGMEHPDTLTSVHCLAYLLQLRKEYNPAAALYERACSGYKKVLEPDHPTTVACNEDYSSLLRKMKD